jgi:predicted RNA-binding Zn ribbon-like protein
MKVCGNQMKARRFSARRREKGPSTSLGPRAEK